MKIKLTLLYLITFCCSINAQDSEVKNSVYLELFGSGGAVYNLTYDRELHSKDRHHISAALGLQYLPGDFWFYEPIASLSPQLNYYYGKTHHIELGVGAAYDFILSDLVVPFRIGYRFQEEEGGLFAKVGFTPLLQNLSHTEYKLIPSAGLAFGLSF